MKVSCPVCKNLALARLEKSITTYFQCTSCMTVFCDPLNNENKVGGGAEQERNSQQNPERIARITQVLGKMKDGPKILDFGCGHGMLVQDLRKDGWYADGYDPYNPEFSKLPPKNTYHIVTMVEVVEHTSSPFYELDVIKRSLVPGGLVMIETSFVDVAAQEDIPLEDFFYISPEVGHSTIFSHHGLDVLMCLKGFIPGVHWNRHVRAYNKPMPV